MEHSFFFNVSLKLKTLLGIKCLRIQALILLFWKIRKNKFLDQTEVLTNSANYGVNSYHCSFSGRCMINPKYKLWPKIPYKPLELMMMT